jgi:hypothetical protein
MLLKKLLKSSLKPLLRFVAVVFLAHLPVRITLQRGYVSDSTTSTVLIDEVDCTEYTSEPPE